MQGGQTLSEKSEIVEKRVGYSWSVTIKKTARTPKDGSKYDDVTESEFTLTGNTDTFEMASGQMATARGKIREQLQP
jgi:hypothetical protein